MAGYKGPVEPHNTQSIYTPKEVEEEERTGLLSGANDYADIPEDKSWSRKKIAVTAGIVIALLVTGAFARILLLGPPKRHYSNHSFTGGELLSNGTHEFKRTVLIVSIDGLRADYLDRGLTPHLLDISKQGLRAKSMKPIFPTLTFPNHWALMTGLHAESHGIVANNFWDPASKEEFHYNQIKSCWNPAWWLGEPMWETAEKAGIITANLMWPGPPKTMSGASSTYFVPWKDKVPLKEKHDQIVQWIDLPFEERPQLIMAYEPSLDQAGHATGPNSDRVNKTLSYVDRFAKDVHKSLKARNLTDIVDIIFVSDHGMTDTSHPVLVYMDDILGLEGLRAIEHEDGWPSMGLRFHAESNVTKYLDSLLKAAKANPEKFDVYTHETMPERYHFANHERIAPIYVVPKLGYVLTTKGEGDVGMTKGNHGYDNNELSMHAMFVAHGPFSFEAKAQHARKSLFARSAAHSKEGWHSTSDDTYIMDRFANVEIYNLVIKLLGIESQAASNNGTAGFWDKYL
ncbi:Phosphodiest-domain-containing protein [Crucibulum laeve]|uniref:Phosphodiest-domain-containing protein n=1 Tax=Crucibulum laeve TaxID=68775 RepID=A0A5C3M5X8_9AGAR|nr:Phosphodiest-domain-containing protein [Crucibulum laeve]